MTIRLNTRHLEYRINPDGTNAAFIDRAAGQDHLDHSAPQPCASVTLGDSAIAASAAASLAMYSAPG